MPDRIESIAREIVRLLDDGLEGQALLTELSRVFPDVTRNEFELSMQEAQAIIDRRIAKQHREVGNGKARKH